MLSRGRPTLLSRVCIAGGALALLILAAVLIPVLAEQPTSVNPTASSVTEQELYESLGSGGTIGGHVTIPDPQAGTLIQPDGRDWREFDQVILPWIGVITIFGMLVVLVAFYLWRGMIRIESGRSGRVVARFNLLERSVHWMTAVCFIILAITGLNITFGKHLLIPLIGPEAFTTWSEWGKYAHNYLSFPFTIGVALIFLMWFGGNLPNRVDVEWIKRGGGFLGGDHAPAYRFNAGQKMIYWIVVIGGTAAAISGYILMFPFYGTTVVGMQWAHMVHGIVAMLFIAAMLGHVYIGTIGMEGAFEAMGSGTVDENWAKEHHSLWFEEEAAKGNVAKAPPSGKVQAAE